MLVARHRQINNTQAFRGRVSDTETGEVVWECSHRHRSVRVGREVRNGGQAAQRCAERELQRRESV